MKKKIIIIILTSFLCFGLAINTMAFEYGNQGVSTNEHFEIKNYNCLEMWDIPPRPIEILEKIDTNPMPTMSFEDLPSQFSWTNYNGNWLTPVKDQAYPVYCGSCYIFGTWGAFEAAINIASGYPDTDIDLSEQYGLSCINAGCNGCGGGWGTTMINNIVSTLPGQQGNGINGVPIESCMPYTATDYIPCDSKCEDWDYHTDPPAPDNKLWQIYQWGWFSTYEKSVSDWNLIKTYIITKGPLAATIAWDSGIQNFVDTHHNPNDVYEYDSSDWTNHIMVLCGWVDDVNILNGGYWILKNSHGTAQGYGGYVNVAYGCNQVACSECSWITAEDWPEEHQGPGPGHPNMHVFADFSYDPECPKIGTPVEFADESQGNVVLREWDFDGDGIIDSNERRPIHTYFEEGDYNVKLTVWSGAGLNSTFNHIIEVKELWPPVAIASPDYYGGDDFSVAFEGRYSYDVDGDIVSYHWDFDDGSTSDFSYVTHEFSQGDRIYNVALIVTDNDGVESTTYCDIRIDVTIPPETIFNVFGCTDLNRWFKNEVEAELIVEDWSGIDITMYKIDDGSFEDYSGSLTIYDEGQHEIEFYSIDIYGNEESVKSQTIKIDKTPPTLDINVYGNKKNDWYTSPIDVSLSGSDQLSGLNKIIYKINQGQWETYSSSLKFSDGENRLWAYSVDNAGNNYGSDEPMMIKVDTGAPVSQCYLNGDGSNNNFYKTVTVSLGVSDSGSGVENVYYSVDGSGFSVYSSSFIIDEIGDHLIEYYAVDNLGNMEETRSVIVTISNVNFDMTLARPTNGLYLFGNRIFSMGSTVIIGSINIEVDISSFTGGPANVQYVEFFVDDVSKMTDTSAPYGWTLNEQTFGTHEIKVVAHTSEDVSITRTINAMVFILF